MKILTTKITCDRVSNSLQLKLFLNGHISGKMRFFKTLNRKFISIGFEDEKDAMLFTLKSLDDEYIKVLDEHNKAKR